MMRRHTIIALLGSLLLLLAACGDGGRGGSDPQATAGGGIGGTGKGTVTSYGSIIVNDIREFQITPQTLVLMDGTPVAEADLKAQDAGLLGTTGRVATFTLGTDVDPEVTGGTALSVHVDHHIVGAVTSVDPFAVLNQRVVLTAGTVRVGATQFQIGDVVAVSGFANPQNVVQGTRVELLNPAPSAWKLVGPVEHLVLGELLTIGNIANFQPVDIFGVTPTDCAGGLQEGALVDVTAQPAFAVGNTLMATAVRCLPAGLQLPPGSPAVVPATFEGLVGSVISLDPLLFSLSGQTVLATSETKYYKGDASDIIEDAQMEVQGTLDQATGVLVADRIRFKQPRVMIRGPLFQNQIDPGLSVTLIGLTVLATELTRDPLGFLQQQQPDSQVRLNGYEFAGEIFANQITRQGTPSTPDNNNVWLRGPVDSIGAPPGQFTILGMFVDAANAGQRIGPDGTSLDVSKFLTLLHVGIDASIVQVEGATYNAGSNTLESVDVIRFIK